MRGCRRPLGHAGEWVAMGQHEPGHTRFDRDGGRFLAGSVAALGIGRLSGLVQQCGHTRDVADGLRVELGVGAIGEMVPDPKP